MKTSDLIGTIKTLALEQMMNAGATSAGKLHISPPAGTPPPPRPAPTPLGATFGGTAADKLKAVDAGKHQSAPRVDGMQGRVSNPPLNTTNNTQIGGGGINANAGRMPMQQKIAASAFAPRGNPSASSTVTKAPSATTKVGGAMASDVRGVESKGRAAQALRSTQNAVVSAVQKKQVASTTQTKPTTATAPKPVGKPAQKSSAQIAAKKARPTARPRPAARPKAQTYRQAADAGSSLSGAHQAGLRESLLKEIKCIAKKKNTKKSNEGDNPKGTPDEVIINPPVGLMLPNR